jgi:hypothetical protein
MVHTPQREKAIDQTITMIISLGVLCNKSMARTGIISSTILGVIN